MAIGSSPGVKLLGHGVDHPPPSNAEVKESVVLYLYSPYGSSWPVPGWALPLPLHVELWPVISGPVSYAGFLVTSCFANVKSPLHAGVTDANPPAQWLEPCLCYPACPYDSYPTKWCGFLFDIHHSLSVCTRKLIREQMCKIWNLQTKRLN